MVFAAIETTPLDEIHVEIVPQGETVTETSSEPTPEAAPVASDDPALAASPDPAIHEDPDVSIPLEKTTPIATASELAAPLPKIQSPDAPQLAVARPRPENMEKSWRQEEERKRKKRQLEEARRQAALRAAKKWEKARARQQAAHAQIGAAAVRAGVREGSGDAPRMSNAAYAALVSAEINRHKHYPPSARQSGSTGSVSVVFSIGPSGAITGHSITRSSGDSAIDAAVHQMMAASHPPPPPGGHFHGSVTISFGLAR
ncbi:TonB family protein (plasmid) [Methylocystis parvus]|uniref:TonB family protein n=2 Tax=Methylocystis parvus TaxID=134 RepID=A0A6B8M7D1_9HYPH|nr:TonB family protein [Methylocystis parvus]